MGRGLVHPVDNMSSSNDASHPELLDDLTAWLVSHNFDLKAYFRELANTKTYQLSSAGGSGEATPQWFQHARSRPLSAEELTASWRTATGYDAANKEGGNKPDRYRPLTRGYVLRFFGQPDNGVGEFQGGLHEHLYLNNGQIGSLIVSGPGSLLDALLDGKASWEERVERLFLQALNRPPGPEERQWMVDFLSAEPDPRQRAEDAIWALITSSEFRFNH